MEQPPIFVTEGKYGKVYCLEKSLCDEAITLCLVFGGLVPFRSSVSQFLLHPSRKVNSLSGLRGRFCDCRTSRRLVTQSLGLSCILQEKSIFLVVYVDDIVITGRLGD